MKLTKTDFIAYLDSPKHLWAIKNNKMDEKEIDVYVQHLFEQGYDVEKYAEKYIQEHLVKKYRSSEDEILLQPSQIDGEFEARTDVLIKNLETNKWDMYEIKSSTKVDKLHKYDVTFQKLVFNKYYELGNIYILHLNKEYIFKEKINLKELFTISDITELTEKLKDEVHLLRYEALEILKEENSDNVLSCIRPKVCPCLELCHKDNPEYSIYDINHLTGSEKKIRELEKMGVKSVYDIPSSFPLSDKQKFQVEVAKSGKACIDINAIRTELASLIYPLYFIDYESFNPAIPMYDGYTPYDQMPFQWSLHILNEENKLEHYEFIETDPIDPIPNFLNSLQNYLGDDGSIIVWHEAFEATQNTRMGEIHSKYKDFCENMNSRIFDIMKIFRDGLYSDPQLKGSYSIKNVLPVLVPELSYKNMEIGDGATAMANWNDMVYGIGASGRENTIIRKNLLKYCELDTYAMVEIYKRLENCIKI